MAHKSRPLVLRLWPEQQHIRTKATDADTTMFVSIGARSGGMHSVLQLVQPQAAVAQWGSDVGHSSSPAASALPSIEPLLRSSALTTKRASSRARVASGDGLRSDTQSLS